jgi:paraquat-inducible protein B
MNKPELDHAIDELDAALTEARGALTKVNARVDPLADSAESALQQVDGMVKPGSPVQYQLIAALQELERAARSVRVLADGLSQQPDSIIFGKGGSED